MSITQRSESINAFFDGFVHSKTSLKEFVEQYSNALASKVQKVNEEDSNSTYKQVPCVTKYVEMERQAQKVYTISKFQEFQEELTGKMYCDFLSSKEDGAYLVYDIQEDILIGESMKQVTFTVSFNKYECEVKCSCKKFEFRGILCRHALTVLIRNNVVRIPEKYILRIWRKDVKRCHTRVKICYNIRSGSIEQSRLDKISRAFNELAYIAVDDEKDCDYVFNLLSDGKKNLEKKKGSHAVDLNSEGSIPNGPDILDPAVNKKKGRPPSKQKDSSMCKRKKTKKKQVDSQEGKKGPYSHDLIVDKEGQTYQQGQTNMIEDRSISMAGSLCHFMTPNDGSTPSTYTQSFSYTPNLMSFNPSMSINTSYVPWPWSPGFDLNQYAGNNYGYANPLTQDSISTLRLQGTEGSNDISSSTPNSNYVARTREHKKS